MFQKNINKTLGLIKGFGPWREKIAKVGGRVYTLNEIEHENGTSSSAAISASRTQNWALNAH